MAPPVTLSRLPPDVQKYLHTAPGSAVVAIVCDGAASGDAKVLLGSVLDTTALCVVVYGTNEHADDPRVISLPVSNAVLRDGKATVTRADLDRTLGRTGAPALASALRDKHATKWLLLALDSDIATDFSDSRPDVLTLPQARQYIVNTVREWATGLSTRTLAGVPQLSIVIISTPKTAVEHSTVNGFASSLSGAIHSVRPETIERLFASDVVRGGLSAVAPAMRGVPILAEFADDFDRVAKDPALMRRAFMGAAGLLLPPPSSGYTAGPKKKAKKDDDVEREEESADEEAESSDEEIVDDENEDEQYVEGEHEEAEASADLYVASRDEATQNYFTLVQELGIPYLDFPAYLRAPGAPRDRAAYEAAYLAWVSALGVTLPDGTSVAPEVSVVDPVVEDLPDALPSWDNILALGDAGVPPVVATIFEWAATLHRLFPYVARRINDNIKACDSQYARFRNDAAVIPEERTWYNFLSLPQCAADSGDILSLAFAYATSAAALLHAAHWLLKKMLDPRDKYSILIGRLGWDRKRVAEAISALVIAEENVSLGADIFRGLVTTSPDLYINGIFRTSLHVVMQEYGALEGVALYAYEFDLVARDEVAYVPRKPKDVLDPVTKKRKKPDEKLVFRSICNSKAAASIAAPGSDDERNERIDRMIAARRSIKAEDFDIESLPGVMRPFVDGYTASPNKTAYAFDVCTHLLDAAWIKENDETDIFLKYGIRGGRQHLAYSDKETQAAFFRRDYRPSEFFNQLRDLTAFDEAADKESDRVLSINAMFERTAASESVYYPVELAYALYEQVAYWVTGFWAVVGMDTLTMHAFDAKEDVYKRFAMPPMTTPLPAYMVNDIARINWVIVAANATSYDNWGDLNLRVTSRAEKARLDARRKSETAAKKAAKKAAKEAASKNGRPAKRIKAFDSTKHVDVFQNVDINDNKAVLENYKLCRLKDGGASFIRTPLYYEEILAHLRNRYDRFQKKASEIDLLLGDVEHYLSRKTSKAWMALFAGHSSLASAISYNIAQLQAVFKFLHAYEEFSRLLIGVFVVELGLTVPARDNEKISDTDGPIAVAAREMRTRRHEELKAAHDECRTLASNLKKSNRSYYDAFLCFVAYSSTAFSGGRSPVDKMRSIARDAAVNFHIIYKLVDPLSEFSNSSVHTIRNEDARAGGVGHISSVLSFSKLSKTCIDINRYINDFTQNLYKGRFSTVRSIAEDAGVDVVIEHMSRMVSGTVDGKLGDVAMPRPAELDSSAHSSTIQAEKRGMRERFVDESYESYAASVYGMADITFFQSWSLFLDIPWDAASAQVVGVPINFVMPTSGDLTEVVDVTFDEDVPAADRLLVRCGGSTGKYTAVSYTGPVKFLNMFLVDASVFFKNVPLLTAGLRMDGTTSDDDAARYAKALKAMWIKLEMSVHKAPLKSASSKSTKEEREAAINALFTVPANEPTASWEERVCISDTYLASYEALSLRATKESLKGAYEGEHMVAYATKHLLDVPLKGGAITKANADYRGSWVFSEWQFNVYYRQHLEYAAREGSYKIVNYKKYLLSYLVYLRRVVYCVSDNLPNQATRIILKFYLSNPEAIVDLLGLDLGKHKTKLEEVFADVHYMVDRAVTYDVLATSRITSLLVFGNSSADGSPIYDDVSDSADDYVEEALTGDGRNTRSAVGDDEGYNAERDTADRELAEQRMKDKRAEHKVLGGDDDDGDFMDDVKAAPHEALQKSRDDRALVYYSDDNDSSRATSVYKIFCVAMQKLRSDGTFPISVVDSPDRWRRLAAWYACANVASLAYKATGGLDQVGVKVPPYLPIIIFDPTTGKETFLLAKALRLALRKKLAEAAHNLSSARDKYLQTAAAPLVEFETVDANRILKLCDVAVGRANEAVATVRLNKAAIDEDSDGTYLKLCDEIYAARDDLLCYPPLERQMLKLRAHVRAMVKSGTKRRRLISKSEKREEESSDQDLIALVSVWEHYYKNFDSFVQTNRKNYKNVLEDTSSYNFTMARYQNFAEDMLPVSGGKRRNVSAFKALKQECLLNKKSKSFENLCDAYKFTKEDFEEKAYTLAKLVGFLHDNCMESELFVALTRRYIAIGEEKDEDAIKSCTELLDAYGLGDTIPTDVAGVSYRSPFHRGPVKIKQPDKQLLVPPTSNANAKFVNYMKRILASETAIYEDALGDAIDPAAASSKKRQDWKPKKDGSIFDEMRGTKRKADAPPPVEDTAPSDDSGPLVKANETTLRAQKYVLSVAKILDECNINIQVYDLETLKIAFKKGNELLVAIEGDDEISDSDQRDISGEVYGSQNSIWQLILRHVENLKTTSNTLILERDIQIAELHMEQMIRVRDKLQGFGSDDFIKELDVAIGDLKSYLEHVNAKAGVVAGYLPHPSSVATAARPIFADVVMASVLPYLYEAAKMGQCGVLVVPTDDCWRRRMEDDTTSTLRYADLATKTRELLKRATMYRVAKQDRGETVFVPVVPGGTELAFALRADSCYACNLGIFDVTVHDPPMPDRVVLAYGTSKPDLFLAGRTPEDSWTVDAVVASDVRAVRLRDTPSVRLLVVAIDLDTLNPSESATHHYLKDWQVITNALHDSPPLFESPFEPEPEPVFSAPPTPPQIRACVRHSDTLAPASFSASPRATYDDYEDLAIVPVHPRMHHTAVHTLTAPVTSYRPLVPTPDGGDRLHGLRVHHTESKVRVPVPISSLSEHRQLPMPALGTQFTVETGGTKLAFKVDSVDLLAHTLTASTSNGKQRQVKFVPKKEDGVLSWSPVNL
jgi:hypothetical protein